MVVLHAFDLVLAGGEVARSQYEGVRRLEEPRAPAFPTYLKGRFDFLDIRILRPD